MNRPIGIFDSGVGGLTVFHEVMKRLPEEDLIYFGDTARVPYGIKSAETVTRYSMEITRFLMGQEIKLLIVACNTASSVAIPALQSAFTIPVLGVLLPGARAAVRYSTRRRIGVIGTEATIGSSAYVAAIRDLDTRIDVHTQACPLFVPLAEEGWGGHPIAGAVAREYLEGLSRTGVDTVVLGCTHYPLLKGAIGKIMGEAVTLVDSALETATEVQSLLLDRRLARTDNAEPLRKYFVTDAPERFRKVGERFLQHPLPNVEKVTL